MPRLMPPAIAAALLATAAAPAHADHRPGHDPGGGGGNRDVTVTLAPDRSFVRFNPLLTPPGGVAALNGRVQGPENGGRVLVLEQNPAPLADGRFEPTGREATSDAQGTFAFTGVITPVNTQYRVRTGTPAALSNVALVNVRLRVSVRVGDTTPRRGQRVRFAGRVSPEHDGKVVAIQRRGSDGVFRTIKRTVARDAPGRPHSVYATRVRVRSTGVYRVVARPGDDDHVSGYSRRRTLRVG